MNFLHICVCICLIWWNTDWLVGHSAVSVSYGLRLSWPRSHAVFLPLNVSSDSRPREWINPTWKLFPNRSVLVSRTCLRNSLRPPQPEFIAFSPVSKRRRLFIAACLAAGGWWVTSMSVKSSSPWVWEIKNVDECLISPQSFESFRFLLSAVWSFPGIKGHVWCFMCFFFPPVGFTGFFCE